MPSFQIAKTDEPKGLVYGWASVVSDAAGTAVVDSQGDIIEPDELESASVDFMLNYRATGEMHEGAANGVIVESLVASPAKYEAMGFAPDVAKAMPVGLWIGAKVTPATFAKVKDGTYKAFSIQGKADRQPVEV